MDRYIQIESWMGSFKKCHTYISIEDIPEKIGFNAAEFQHFVICRKVAIHRISIIIYIWSVTTVTNNERIKVRDHFL